MSKVLSSIACNLDSNLLLASLPLLDSGRVQAIEWSFDALFRFEEIPPWFTELLQVFSDSGRLVGHGILFSLFSGKWLPEQTAWLKQLETLSQSFRFDHITEHFGFMTGEDFHKGAPLSIPCTPQTLALGQDRLKRIQAACNCPVGLENLAFAYTLDEVRSQGDFLSQLLAPVNGFIILDLHNLYCQLQNFDISFEDLIRLYPLDKVREIHISGGSWEDSDIIPIKKVRRDTHDDCVPLDVFSLLEKSLPLCPHVKFVVLEQVSAGLRHESQREGFQADFTKMDDIVTRHNVAMSENNIQPFLVPQMTELNLPLEDLSLYAQQLELSTILETAGNYEDARQRLTKSSLAQTVWNIEDWSPYMVETALRIAQKWKDGL